jgi:hypothetical protein
MPTSNGYRPVLIGYEPGFLKRCHSASGRFASLHEVYLYDEYLSYSIHRPCEGVRQMKLLTPLIISQPYPYTFHPRALLVNHILTCTQASIERGYEP